MGVMGLNGKLLKQEPHNILKRDAPRGEVRPGKVMAQSISLQGEAGSG